MNRKIITVIAAAVLLTVITMSIKRETSFVAQPAGIAVQETYPKRMIRNVEVKNYNIVGDKISFYDRVPQRVVAVGENINETLVALGVEDKIICSVKYGNPYYVPEEKYAERYNKIHFESGIILNTETVLALAPDLIISGQSLFTNKGLKSTEFWNQRNIHTFLPENANSPALRNHRESLELEYKFIAGLGMIFNKEEQAGKIIAEMQETVKNVQSRIRGRRKPKVMIVEGLGKNLVAYDDSKLAGDICTRLGAHVPSSPFGTVGLEYLLAEDPDVIFVVKSGGDPEAAAEYFKNIPALQSLKAVRNNRICGIALNYTYNSAIKTGSGIKKMAKCIYPDLFDI